MMIVEVRYFLVIFVFSLDVTKISSVVHISQIETISGKLETDSKELERCLAEIRALKVSEVILCSCCNYGLWHYEDWWYYCLLVVVIITMYVRCMWKVHALFGKGTLQLSLYNMFTSSFQLFLLLLVVFNFGIMSHLAPKLRKFFKVPSKFHLILWSDD